MEFGEKEKAVILAALNQYMASIEKSLNDGELEEGESADLVNDATLLEIIISRFEEEA